MKKEKKQFLVLSWLGLCAWHPLLAIYFIPSFVAVARSHRHPYLVFALNVIFGWTPAWLLVLLYSIERPDQPSPMLSRFGRRNQERSTKRVRNNVKTKVRTVII